MNREQWGKLPCHWQTQTEIHRRIAAAQNGAAIAALKLYIGFCVKANFKEKKGLPPGCVKLPVAHLSKVIGVSKPMTIAGLRLLTEWDLVERLGGRPAAYRLREYDTPGLHWEKLPSSHLYGNSNVVIERLARLDNRGKARLHALQLYLYLASVRNRSSLKATVSFDRLCDVLSISRNDVSRAISMLSADELLSVRRADATDMRNDTRPSNEYWLRGTTPLHGVNNWPRGAAASDFPLVE
jgi:hypothetical protein